MSSHSSKPSGFVNVSNSGEFCPTPDNEFTVLAGRAIPFPTELNDLATARVHFDGGYSFFLTAHTQAKRPNRGLSSATLFCVAGNAMSHRSPLCLQCAAIQKFDNGPIKF